MDYCAVAEIIEDIDNSYSDRAACEAKTILRGDWTVLSLTTPLELGGRRYNTPGLGITNQGFDGCIKDLQHNGIVSVDRSGTGTQLIDSMLLSPEYSKKIITKPD